MPATPEITYRSTGFGCFTIGRYYPDGSVAGGEISILTGPEGYQFRAFDDAWALMPRLPELFFTLAEIGTATRRSGEMIPYSRVESAIQAAGIEPWIQG